MNTSAAHKGIENIIFDLGGVILDIDFQKTEQAFMNLGLTDFGVLFNQFHATELFKDFEKGKINPESFIHELSSIGGGLSSQDVVSAWNALLLDFPPGRISFIQCLQKKYRTFLLSNTNIIHYDAFQEIYSRTSHNENSFDGCFEKAYYSFQMGMRKPDEEIFKRLLAENGLAAEKTLYVDDTPSNVVAAEKLGMKGVLVTAPLIIEDLLSSY